MAGGEKGPPAPEWEEHGETESQVEDLAARPNMYKVVLLNDDYTTMEFVVQVLMDIFNHPRDRAIEIMLKVHHEGAGVAGVYPYSVAETKAQKVHRLARREGYPLRCTLEPA